MAALTAAGGPGLCSSGLNRTDRGNDVQTARGRTDDEGAAE